MKFGKLKAFFWNYAPKSKLPTGLDARRGRLAAGLINAIERGYLETAWQRRMLGRRHPLVLSGRVKWSKPLPKPLPGIFGDIRSELIARRESGEVEVVEMIVAPWRAPR